MSQEALATRVEKTLPLPLFCIFIDPVDSREVVVTNSSARTLHIPVQGGAVFRIGITVQPCRPVRLQWGCVAIQPIMRPCKAKSCI